MNKMIAIAGIGLSLILAANAQAGGLKKICLKDEFGEQVHLKLLPNGLISGYSQFNGAITGTAFGSYTYLSEQEVMIGGDINNDCASGLFPGKLNVRYNLKTQSGHANGFLFLCSDGSVLPFESAITPCDE